MPKPPTAPSPDPSRALAAIRAQAALLGVDLSAISDGELIEWLASLGRAGAMLRSARLPDRDGG